MPPEQMQKIVDGAPEGADHYIILFKKVKYLQKTKNPTLMTKVVQFVFRIKPL